MKKLIILSLLLFSVFSLSAQQAPGVAWRTIDYEHYTPDFPTAIHIPGLNEYGPNEYQHQEDTGEDWWMDITNAYDGSGNHIGYMVAGFSRWIGYTINSFGIGGGCNSDLNGTYNQYDDCDGRVVNNTMTPYVGTAGLYDLNGKQVWTKYYSLDGDAYFGIIRDSDGNYLMIGNTRDVIDPYGNLIPHNPDLLSNIGGIDLRTFTECGTKVKRMLITKIDPNGNILWNYTYAFPTLPGNSNSDVYNATSNGYDIVEDAANNGYVISGSSSFPGMPSGSMYLMALHIDKNGNILNTNVYGDPGFTMSPRNIIEFGGDYYLSAIRVATAPSFDNTQGIVYKIDDNTNLIDWGTSWGTGNQPKRFIQDANGPNGYVCHDLVEHNGNVLVTTAEIIEGGCTFAGVNAGDFYFRALNPNTGGEITSALYPQFITSARAFDFKSGLTKTSDGGLGFVTSVRTVAEPTGTEPDLVTPLTNFNNMINSVDDGFNTYSDCQYSRNTSGAYFGFGIWRTDTYIAKFDAVGNKVWETSFDSDDNGPTDYPGDFKEQECVYHITEAADGGLVICGNTSHNHDDYYIAKVFSDCQIDENYDEKDLTDNIIDITGNTLWNSNRTVLGTVRIAIGATLTVDNGAIIEFADTRRTGIQTKIIVEKGGKLVVKNNSVLTSLNNCEKAFWDGIHVEGTTGTTQSNINQGYVEVTDSRIENAIYGITTRAVDANGETDLTQTGGGVIKALRSNFTDCYIALEFEPFVRYVGTTAVSNVSFIRDCDFTTTDNFGDNSDITKPYTFVKNYGTYNIQIKGNRFINERDELSPGEWGNGIISMDAGYSVNDLCNSFFFPCPTGSLVKNEFYNLQTGIEVNQGGASNFKVNVDDAVFDNNLTGIRVNGGQFGNLTNNDFVIPVPNYGPQFKDASGIYLNGTWGYRVEGNILNNRGGFISGRNNGIITVDSDNGGSGLTIYRNEFNNLMTGAETIGQNTMLQIDCNEFHKSSVYGIADIFHADGNLADQGTCSGAALDATVSQANEFFGSCNNMDNLQIHRNPSASVFDYNDHNLSTTGFSLSCISTGISGSDCALATTLACPTNLGFPFVFRKNLFKTNIIDLSNDITERKNLIDGGNTQTLLNYIATHSSPGQIKNYLQSYSPYLSDEVLIAVIDKNLPHGILKQILIDNSSLSEKVMARLETYSLPNGIRNQIMAVQNGIGPMIDLLNAIEFLENEKLINVNDLVSTHLDSAEVDSAILVLKTYGNFQSQCALVPIIAKRDTTTADTIITRIEMDAQTELIANTDCKTCQDKLTFCDFQKLMFAVNSRQGGYFSLNEREKLQLEEIAESEAPIAANAHAILNFIDFNTQHLNGMDYLLPNGVVRSYHLVTDDQKSENKMLIYPNPANENITIEFSEIDENGSIQLLDIYGKLIMQTRTMNMNKIQIITSELPNGMYLIVFNNSSNETQSEKLVINR